jgi:hypothetical protein
MVGESENRRANDVIVILRDARLQRVSLHIQHVESFFSF